MMTNTNTNNNNKNIHAVATRFPLTSIVGVLSFWGAVSTCKLMSKEQILGRELQKSEIRHLLCRFRIRTSAIY